ncbi:MAG: transposase [Gammaproteobacteria bacterium]
MARQPRINYNNSWHHVTNRGAASKTIFHSNNDRKKFLSLLQKTIKQYEIEVHAYCLMSNHYHLLIKTPSANLSSAIRYLNSLYAAYYNHTRKTDGPLFKGRFKSTIVSHDTYLLYVSRYIHLNPVRANMVKKPQNYQWSSYAAYLQNVNPPKWLHLNKILGYFSGKNTIAAYKEFVETEHKEQPYKNGKWVTVYGNREFEEIIKKLKRKYSIEITKNITKNYPTIEKIKKEVAKYYKVNLDEIEKPTPFTTNTPRIIAMWLARKIGKYSLKEIAKEFSNKSYSSVSTAIWRIKIQNEKNFTIMEDIHKLEKKLLEQ